MQNLQVIMKQLMQVDESNLLVWQGLLVPDSAPYNKVPLQHMQVHCALRIMYCELYIMHASYLKIVPVT